MIRTNTDLLDYIALLQRHSVNSIGVEAFKAKQLILEQDRRYNTVYVIKKGIAKCYITDENGKEFIQEFLGAGMEFGELEVFSEKMTICSVSSVSELETYTFSHRIFNELLEKDPKFNKMVMKALADKIRYKAPRHSYQHSYPIEDNILRLKRTFPEFTDVLPKKDIANYIGITTRSLNRALKDLKESGK
ncbi:Crp/Fnr family transcriptional regulator [Flagellimonas allohymeniacidonis]|uniref:Crp/Fnr family transcriptional regulator n=1 Tax=Flagellimonas allohymeniacidonis TaxID=2517819 RepID=A0A4Q8QHT2_9FLAO|nr:Crp/Fnr family transcriptional regulator [Allomuricauda hymeniacidonis]TAI48848.1 Crp/Fnr family transcriptional regulator [Allomuricauda hymeniacidonis]